MFRYLLYSGNNGITVQGSVLQFETIRGENCLFQSSFIFSNLISLYFTVFLGLNTTGTGVLKVR